jgi:L-cysteate sulfo-lyase
LGLECHLVLNRSEGNDKPASMACSEWAGAVIHFVDERANRAPAMDQLASELRANRRKAVVIPLGASTWLGALGYVAAASELASQMQAKDLRFNGVFFSSSSGGTHAGLAVGRELFLPHHVKLYGVSPDDPAGSIQTAVKNIVDGVAENIRLPLETPITVLDDYVGEGYGIESRAGREALELLARTEGILLDPVYTAKAMAGLLDWIRTGRFKPEENILFWHTGGQLALFHK